MRERESRGRPASPQALDLVAEVADALFLQCPFDEKIEDILHFPAEISARRLAKMTDRERAEILSHLPTRLVEEITSLLPVR